MPIVADELCLRSRTFLFLTAALILATPVAAQLAPLAYAANVKVDEQGARTTVTDDQDRLDRLGGKAPVADDRFRVRTTYVLESGLIGRTDVFTPKAGVVSTRALADEKAYRSPTGAMTALTRCAGAAEVSGPIKVSWTMSYK